VSALVEVIHADAMDLELAWFQQFHTLICDPPYSPYVHESATSVGHPTQEGLGVHSRDFEFDHLSPELRLWISMAAASVQRWTAIFSDHESTHLWREDMAAAGAEYVRYLPWVRWSQPQLSGDRPPSGSEAVQLFHSQHVGPRGGRRPVKKRWNGSGSLTHLDARCMRGKDKHPTEKPIDLLLDLVSWLTEPGELVLDLCGGAATTAIACRLLDRSCFAIEKKPEWARQGQSRVMSALSPRDELRAREWCVRRADQAEEEIADARKLSDEESKGTIGRAERRLRDITIVCGNL
jgi:hypothetical protein